ncbi:hypothetical protein LCGC14_1163540 [marine sediment metagenome]|uniref:Uncharacterized protein n=1 Tax=marine sediment metagenome TaxID=412755 RepID=A0A0F9PXI2_9ZZZZ
MPQIVHLILDGQGALAKLADVQVRTSVGHIIVTSLPDGMASGKPSVAIISELEDGSYVFLEMSLAMFQTVNVGLRGRYGDIE